VKVEAKFVNPIDDLLANASAEVNIIISQKEKAITIPKSFLVNKDSVWIEKDNYISKIKITKGIETIDFVEIISGLDANTTLIEK
jgi:multidrug efflux pump subunit AcrA (membrane-fusion protein)